MVDTSTGAGADSDRSEQPGELESVLERRRLEIDDRIEQLHERQRQLGDRLAHGATSPETLESAAARAIEAEAHAQAAHVRSRQAHEMAAHRHLAAAKAHERVADVLDEHDEPERAEQHREAAQHDWEAVSEAQRAADAE